MFETLLLKPHLLHIVYDEYYSKCMELSSRVLMWNLNFHILPLIYVVLLREYGAAGSRCCLSDDCKSLDVNILCCTSGKWINPHNTGSAFCFSCKYLPQSRVSLTQVTARVIQVWIPAKPDSSELVPVAFKHWVFITVHF